MGKYGGCYGTFDSAFKPRYVHVAASRTLIPDSWHGVNVGIAVLIPLLALPSPVLAGVAIFRKKDRSLLLIVFAALVLLLALGFGIGELLFPH